MHSHNLRSRERKINPLTSAERHMYWLLVVLLVQIRNISMKLFLTKTKSCDETLGRPAKILFSKQLIDLLILLERCGVQQPALASESMRWVLHVVDSIQAL